MLPESPFPSMAPNHVKNDSSVSLEKKPSLKKDSKSSTSWLAVIGQKFKETRDDFKPLNLQNPWRSGKLFVRMKNDVLAALERINSSSRLRSTDVSMSASTPNMAPPARSSNPPTTTVL